MGGQAANAILNQEKMQLQDALEAVERRLHAADAVVQQQQTRLVRPSATSWPRPVRNHKLAAMFSGITHWVHVRIRSRILFKAYESFLCVFQMDHDKAMTDVMVRLSCLRMCKQEHGLVLPHRPAAMQVWSKCRGASAMHLWNASRQAFIRPSLLPSTSSAPSSHILLMELQRKCCSRDRSHTCRFVFQSCRFCCCASNMLQCIHAYM
jgi:hypothetical protein